MAFLTKDVSLRLRKARSRFVTSTMVHPDYFMNALFEQLEPLEETPKLDVLVCRTRAGTSCDFRYWSLQQTDTGFKRFSTTGHSEGTHLFQSKVLAGRKHFYRTDAGAIEIWSRGGGSRYHIKQTRLPFTISPLLSRGRSCRRLVSARTSYNRTLRLITITPYPYRDVICRQLRGNNLQNRPRNWPPIMPFSNYPRDIRR
jgi:hypothetical protein